MRPFFIECPSSRNALWNAFPSFPFPVPPCFSSIFPNLLLEFRSVPIIMGNLSKSYEANLSVLQEIRQEYEEAGLEDVVRTVNERMREEP